jgi:hypothetical protein
VKRSHLLAAALLATLAATAWIASREDEAQPDAVVLLPPRGDNVAGRPRGDVPPPAAWPRAPVARSREPWPFEVSRTRAWSVPTAAATAPRGSVATAPSAPSLPQAPMFPYALIGRIDDGSTVHALLSGSQRTLGVRLHDVIDGQWRVDAIGSRDMTLTWLPGGLSQTLAFRPS